MSYYGDMYRELAQRKRREAEEYDQLAIDADERDFAQREAQRFVSEASRLEILAAQGMYNQSPRIVGRSDDSYSTWTEPARWDDLGPEEQAEYIRRVRDSTT